MSGEPHRAAILEIELKILRALCRDAHEASEREILLDKLKTYSWKDDEHRVVFEAISGLRRADEVTLRALLPAAATRMGFPEILWDDYFAGNLEENVSLQDRLRELIPPRLL